MVKVAKQGAFCRELQEYLSDRLDLPERLLFEDHLSSCPACSEEIAFWHEFSPELEDWKSSKTADQVTQGDIYRLVSDAAAGKKPALPAFRPTFVWTAAGACAAALALLLITGDFGGTGLGPQPVATQGVKAPADNPVLPPQVASQSAPAQVFETAIDQTLTQQVADDTIGLAANTQLDAFEQDESHTKYRLQRGTAAFKVAKRSANRAFTVEVAAYRVEVVGTEFSVSFLHREQIRVAVRYGAVRVMGPNSQSWALQAGERLILGAGPQAAAEPAAEKEIASIAALVDSPEQPELAVEESNDTPEARRATRRRTGAKNHAAIEELRTLKQWLAAGETERALKETERYVAANPRSGPGWMLLGDCHRKQGSWTQAIDAYEHTMKNSVPRLKSRAMYQAATIHQQKLGQHRQAIGLYEAYLQSRSGTKSLRAVAKLNLAKSLIATGNKARAKTLLEEVVQSQKDNYLSKNAREILSNL